MLNSTSSSTRNTAVIAALTHNKNFNFFKATKYLVNGLCPFCGRHTITTPLNNPAVLTCSRSVCSFSKKTSELFPVLYREIPEKKITTNKLTSYSLHPFCTLQGSNEFIDLQLSAGLACSRVETDMGYLVTTLRMNAAG